MPTKTTTTTKTTAAKATPVKATVKRQARLAFDTPDLGRKVKEALLASGVEVKVIAPKDDRDATRRLQKKIQTIGYNAGHNANFRVVNEAGTLRGYVVDPNRGLLRPGQTEPTLHTPPKKEAVKAPAKKAPVKRASNRTSTTKATTTKATPTTPRNLSGVTGKVDTKTVKVTRVTKA